MWLADRRLVSLWLHISPCGRHILFSLRVCPFVRKFVTLPLSKSYLPEPFVQKKYFFSTINIYTEVVQQAIKIKFCQKKTLFWICDIPSKLLFSINGGDTQICVVLAKTLSLGNVRVNCSKCKTLVVFEQCLQFAFFLIRFCERSETRQHHCYPIWCVCRYIQVHLIVG